MNPTSTPTLPNASSSGHSSSHFAQHNPLLHEAETLALIARRKEVLGESAAQRADEMGLPRVGLALSSGGVRSATFGLGLLRGLAQSLHRLRCRD
jgi:hypothetical protein